MAEGFRYVPKVACEHSSQHMFLGVGIFNGEDTLTRVLPYNLLRLSMFFVTSRALRYLLKPLKQTKFNCDMLAGILLGSPLFSFKRFTTYKETPNHLQFISFASCLGLLSHIFLINVKIDSKRVLKVGKKVRILGLAAPLSAFAMMVVLNAMFHPLTFKAPGDRYKFAFQIACNSVVNIAPTLEELNLLTTEMGQLALSAALITDMLAASFWLLSILHQSFTDGFVRAIVPLSMVIAFTLYVLRPAMQWIVKRTPHGQPVKEAYVFGVLLSAMAVSTLFDVIAGLNVVGIVFFGLMVPNGPPLGSAVVEMCEMFVNNLLLPFFYLSVGDMIDLSTITDWKGHLTYQFIVLVGHISRTLVVTMLAMVYNMSHRQSITLGLIANAAGVSDEAFTWLSWVRQRSDSLFASLMVFSSLIKGALVAPLAIYFYKKHHKRDHESFRGFELSIQAASSCSKLRILACIDSEEDVPGITTLLEVSNPTETNPIYAYVVHVTELIGEAIPILTPHNKHKRICKHNGCIGIMKGLKWYCDNSYAKISIQLLTMIAPFKNMHEGLCRLAHDKMIPLIIVPFHYKSPSPYRQRIVSSDLNRKIQSNAPCTVGVFVDKGTMTTLRNKQSYFSYKILVLFFGGEDDREVLAYASRMAGHASVSMLTLRFIVEVHQKINNEDNDLDEQALDEFRARITDNTCVVFQEFYVHDWLEAIQVIRALDNEHDLVMVGRRHGDHNTTEEHQDRKYVLSDAPELGFIGETLCSYEFEDRAFSVLVMQQCMGVDKENLSTLMSLENDDLC